MKPLPMPLRLAAGLVATAIEEVRELPRKLIELPVTAVSQVLQASMRMQQRVTELAIRGDQALGGLRPVPETPTWARFDEDEMDHPYGGGGGPFGGGMDRPFSGGNGLAGVPSDADWNAPPPRSAPRTVSPIRIARDPEPDGFDEFADEFDDLEFTDTRGPGAEPDRPDTLEAVSEPESVTGPPAKAAAKSPTKPAAKSSAKPAAKSSAKPAASSSAKPPAKPAAESNGSSPAGHGAASGSKTTKTTKPTKAARTTKATAPAAPETGPKGHEDYPTWTLPQLRGHFRSLSLEDVKALLAWETGHLDRPPYVTMLSNRIASITGR
jgi:hypothetical protein